MEDVLVDVLKFGFFWSGDGAASFFYLYTIYSQVKFIWLPTACIISDDFLTATTQRTD